MDVIELPNQEKIRILGEKENHKYLKILEADTIKQAEMKEKKPKEYLWRTRKLLEIKSSTEGISSKWWIARKSLS